MTIIREINGFQNLESLCLKNLKINNIDFFISVSDIVEMKLFHCDLSQIEWNITCLDGLRKLNVDSPRNHKLFKLNGLSSLTCLNMNNLNLKLFSDFDFIKNLSEKLTEIGLKSILNSMYDQQINELFSKEYKNLTKLDLSRNNFTEISESNERNVFNPSNFQNLKNLEILNFGNNKIEKIEEKSFSELKNLVELVLDNLLIKELTSDIFKGIINLKTLDLSHNQFTYFNLDIISNLSNLKIINFANFADTIENFDEVKHFLNKKNIILKQ